MLCILLFASFITEVSSFASPTGGYPSFEDPVLFSGFVNPSSCWSSKLAESHLVSFGRPAIVQGIGLATIWDSLIKRVLAELARQLQEFSQSGSFYGGFVGGIDADNLSGA